MGDTNSYASTKHIFLIAPHTITSLGMFSFDLNCRDKVPEILIFSMRNNNSDNNYPSKSYKLQILAEKKSRLSR